MKLGTSYRSLKTLFTKLPNWRAHEFCTINFRWELDWLAHWKGFTVDSSERKSIQSPLFEKLPCWNPTTSVKRRVTQPTFLHIFHIWNIVLFVIHVWCTYYMCFLCWSFVDVCRCPSRPTGLYVDSVFVAVQLKFVYST